MLIEDNWCAIYDNSTDIKENNSLKNLSGQWSAQISVSITNHSNIVKGPTKYTLIKKR